MFLVALCLSIFLEAISRLFEPQSVSNPKLVFIVGTWGLISNIIGLALFHEHSHNHGGHQGQPHAGNGQVSAAEQGRAVSAVHTQIIADEGGNIEDVLPEAIVGGFRKSARRIKVSDENSKDQSKEFHKGHEEEPTVVNPQSPVLRKSSMNSTWPHVRRTSGSRSRSDDIHGHPVIFRNKVIATSSLLDNIHSETASDSDAQEASEQSPLLTKSKSYGSSKDTDQPAAPRPLKTGEGSSSGHKDHKHTQRKKENQKDHEHGDLNMRGILLHVMGDALGNIGVMGSALIIGLTNYSWRFYSDPFISLIITIIILCSAIPLCKAASRILLQAVPEHISIDDIKNDIKNVQGVFSCHDLHVWQLSDSNFVASLHIEVDYDFIGHGSARYMQLAREIRECLHEYDIHSSTIQPEFYLDKDHGQAMKSTADDEGLDTNKARGSGTATNTTSKNASRAASIRSERNACLLKCGDECEGRSHCCAPALDGSEGHDEGGHSH